MYNGGIIESVINYEKQSKSHLTEIIIKIYEFRMKDMHKRVFKKDLF